MFSRYARGRMGGEGDVAIPTERSNQAADQVGACLYGLENLGQT